MRKSVTAVILLFISFLLFPASAKAEAITKINDLIEHAKELDGKELIIQGEAIGESMNRGSYSWVNINDGTNAIGVWMSKSEADKIMVYGNYKNIGDTVIIKGVFNRACKEHGGEADFHGASFIVTENGHQVKTQVPAPKIISAAALTLLALFMYRYFYKVRDKST